MLFTSLYHCHQLLQNQIFIKNSATLFVGGIEKGVKHELLKKLMFNATSLIRKNNIQVMLII